MQIANITGLKLFCELYPDVVPYLYLDDKGTPITPQDLADHHCLAMIRSNEELKTWHFSDDTQHNVITVLPKRFSDDGEVIRQWALDSAGIALKSILDIRY